MLIAQLPFLSCREDLNWERRFDDLGSYYLVAPETGRLRSSIAEALDNLDDSGAYLGILSESCLNDDLLEEWKLQLQKKRRPPTSNLTWLMVGTGPVRAEGPACYHRSRPPNRAVLLHRETGKVLLTQDKQYGFTLDVKQQQIYGALIGSEKPYEHGLGEFIAQGETLNLLESASGRYAVLICEDLGRLLTLGATAMAAGVSHILVPVLSTAMHGTNWASKAAVLLAEHAGAAVAISNSLAIDRFTPKEYAPGKQEDIRPPTLIVSIPERRWPVLGRRSSYGPKLIPSEALPVIPPLSDSDDALGPRCELL
ncbi:hypothetical protein [Nonomuraea dietziae]